MRHSVVLDFKKCRGCTTCIKNCPTEAIRVRSGKATILPNRCIDCGTCIRVCPHKAVKSVCDDFSALKNYRYTIAIPDPALYGSFRTWTMWTSSSTAFWSWALTMCTRRLPPVKCSPASPGSGSSRSLTGPCQRSLLPVRRWFA